MGKESEEKRGVFIWFEVGMKTTTLYVQWNAKEEKHKRTSQFKTYAVSYEERMSVPNSSATNLLLTLS